MTDTTPAPPADDPVVEPVQAVTATQTMPPETMPPAVVDDGLEDMRRMWQLGKWMAMLEDPGPAGAQAAGAVAAWLARDLELPGNAFMEISIIDSKPYLSARLLRILALRQGFRINPSDLTERACTAVLEDVYGHELGQATYTIEDAQRAGLADKRNYKRDPQSMLWARAARRVLDFYAPNVLFGLSLPTDPPQRAGEPRRIPPAGLDFTGDVDDPPPFDGGYQDDDGVPL